LKGLRNTEDVRFENQLRTNAMRIANREVLYYYLRKKPVSVPVTETTETDHKHTRTGLHETLTETGQEISLVNILKDSPADGQKDFPEAAQKDLPEASQEVTPEISQKKSLADGQKDFPEAGQGEEYGAYRGIPAETGQEGSLTDDMTDNQQTVIETARSSAELVSEIEKSTVEEIGKNGNKEHTVVISDSPEIDDSNASIIIIDEESGEVEEKIFYMDPGFSVSEHSELLELMSDKDSGEEDRKPAVPEKHDRLSQSKQRQDELIERFILTNPRIEQPAAKSDTPNEDISKPFVEGRDGLLTETLARIYTKQGYYSRAIDIYEKLSLKFPEKSGYFASQIEKVKELIKK
jgi:hypothetical protein